MNPLRFDDDSLATVKANMACAQRLLREHNVPGEYSSQLLANMLDLLDLDEMDEEDIEKWVGEGCREMGLAW